MTKADKILEELLRCPIKDINKAFASRGLVCYGVFELPICPKCGFEVPHEKSMMRDNTDYPKPANTDKILDQVLKETRIT